MFFGRSEFVDLTFRKVSEKDVLGGIGAFPMVNGRGGFTTYTGSLHEKGFTGSHSLCDRDLL